MLRRLAGAALAILGTACGTRTGLSVELRGTSLPNPSMACADGGPLATVYAFDEAGVLYAYDPRSGVATALGTPNCGNGIGFWTMTATRDTAYITYQDGTLYAVDLATLACTQTPFTSGQLGAGSQSGVAAVGTGATARIFFYVAPNGAGPPFIAAADTQSFVLTKVGDVLPEPPAAAYVVNLTADDEGNLYAYSPDGFVQKIDQATGAVIASRDSGVTTMSTWATIAYGPELYLWAGARVVRYDLAAGVQEDAHDAGVYAIGAGSYPACGMQQ